MSCSGARNQSIKKCCNTLSFSGDVTGFTLRQREHLHSTDGRHNLRRGNGREELLADGHHGRQSRPMGGSTRTAMGAGLRWERGLAIGWRWVALVLILFGVYIPRG